VGQTGQAVAQGQEVILRHFMHPLLQDLER
jgi:hypothetical protein